MRSNRICSQCLRALRQSPAAPNQALRQITPRSSRQLSTTPTLTQQPQQREQESPPPPPAQTISPTISPDAHSTPFSAPFPPTTDPQPSTRQMQSAIRSSLSRPSTFDKIAAKARSTAPSATQTYVTYGLTESIFKSCSSLVNYTIPESSRTQILTGKGPPKTADGEDIGQALPSSVDSIWFKEIGLLPTFSTWSQVTYLHMYLITVLLRASLPSQATYRDFQKYLLEHFSQDAEEKMLILHTISARGIRNQYLKDLFLRWRGVLAAYDEGMVSGDAELGAAVWRNLFKGDENVDWVKVERIVAYMRVSVIELTKMANSGLLANEGVLSGKDGLWERSWRLVDEVDNPTTI